MISSQYVRTLILNQGLSLVKLNHHVSHHHDFLNRYILIGIFRLASSNIPPSTMSIKRSCLLTIPRRVPLLEQEMSSLPLFKCSSCTSIFCVVLCPPLFVSLSLFFSPLYCMSSALRLPITYLVSANFSCFIRNTFRDNGKKR